MEKWLETKLTLTCTWSTQSNIEFVEHSGRIRREKHWEKLSVSCTISILSPTSSAWTYCKKCLLKVYTCPYGKETWACTSSRREHTAALQSSWSRHSKKTVTFADSRIPITCIQVSLCSPELSSRWTKFWFFVNVSHQLNSVGRSTATSQSWCLSLSPHRQKAHSLFLGGVTSFMKLTAISTDSNCSKIPAKERTNQTTWGIRQLENALCKTKSWQTPARFLWGKWWYHFQKGHISVH